MMKALIFRSIKVVFFICISLRVSSQENLSAIKTTIEGEFDAYKTSVNDFKKLNDNSLVGFTYPYSSLLNTFEQSLTQEGLVKEYAAALIVINSHHLKQIRSLDESQAEKIKEIFKVALKSIPPRSPHWQLEAPGEAPLTRMASGLLEEHEAQALYTAIYERNQNYKVRSGALLELAKLSFMKGDMQIMTDQIKELRSYEDLSSFIRTELYMLNPAGRLFIGDRIPKFEISLLTDESLFSNNDMVGKFYLLDFWGTWCPPCIEEMPFLHQAYEQFKDRNFEILSIAYGDKKERVDRFRSKWPMPWTHAVLNSFKDDLLLKFDIWHAPTAFLISPDGKIIASEFMLRGDALLETLNRELPNE